MWPELLSYYMWLFAAIYFSYHTTAYMAKKYSWFRRFIETEEYKD